MQIGNVLINADLLSIMTELKRQLADAGINKFAKMFYSNDDLMICCPYHKDGQERRPSAGIRKSDGLFHCLACGETHSLQEVISYCLGYNDPLGKEGLKWLAKNFASAEVQNREEIKIDVRRNSIGDSSRIIHNSISSHTRGERSGRTDNIYVTEKELDSYRYTHKYMYERGLTDDTIDLFDIGYDARTDSITFPVKDSTGNCIFVARRSIRSKHFNLPKGIDKPLYGLYECYSQSKLSEVYVCEGLFDCLRLWCNGKVAVAGFGCLFNALQIEQLKSLPTRKLILALDNDDAGRYGADRILRSVTNKIITKAVLPKHRKDIGECTDDEIQNLEEVF